MVKQRRNYAVNEKRPVPVAADLSSSAAPCSTHRPTAKCGQNRRRNIRTSVASPGRADRNLAHKIRPRCTLYSSTAVPRYHDDGHGIKMTKKGFSESRPVAITSLVAAQTVAPVFAYAQPSGGPFDRTRQK